MLLINQNIKKNMTGCILSQCGKIDPKVISLVQSDLVKIFILDIHYNCKNPAMCGDTSFTLVPNFGRFLKPSLIFMSNFVDDLRAKLHYVQHCITWNIALHATLHYIQHCITCNIALCAILHNVQHCIS